MVPCVATAQLVPPQTTPTSVILRDGERTFHVTRDSSDPSRVIAARDDGALLSSRVDRHAVVRVVPSADARAVLAGHDVEIVRAIAPSIGAYRVVDRRGGDGLDLAARLAGASGVIDAVP